MRQQRIPMGCALLFLVILQIVRLVGVQDFSDSDIFRYIGWSQTQGQSLFSQIWDNKPPLIFWYHRLGIRLGDIGFQCLISATFFAIWGLSLYSLSRFFNKTSAAWAALFIIIYIADADGGTTGDRPEVLSALFCCVGLAIVAFKKGRYEGSAFLIAEGVLTALCFMTKPTYIGLGIFLILWWSRQFSLRQEAAATYIKRLLWSATGFILGLLACAAPFISKGNTAEFLDASFTYNALEYNSQGFFLLTLLRNACTTLPALTVPAGLLLLVYALRGKNLDRSASVQHKLAQCASIWILAEWALASYVDSLSLQYIVQASIPIAILTLACMESSGISFKLKAAAVTALGIGVLFTLAHIAAGLIQYVRNVHGCEIPVRYALEQPWIRDRIALFGGAKVCRIAYAKKLPTPQKYTIGLLHYKQSCSHARHKEIAEDALRTITHPEVKAILSEQELHTLPWASTCPAFAQAVSQWELEQCVGGVFFYRRRNR